MTRGPQVPDEENAALQKVLVDLKESGASWRDIGLRLGYGLGSAQWTVSNATKTRVGRDMADRIYEKLLKTTRVAFLKEHGLERLLGSSAGLEMEAGGVFVANDTERVLRIGALRGVSAADALQVVQSVAAYKGEVTDRVIGELFEAIRAKPSKLDPDVVHDDLGGGLGDAKKARTSRKSTSRAR